MKMPRTTKEIIEHAEELAKVFEDFEPSPDTPVTMTPLGRLYTAVQARSRTEQLIVAEIHAAREAGQTWAAIGEVLGTTGEAARQRYGQLIPS
jgi:hypothetical protein